MRPLKEDQHEHARSLYFQTGYSRADIADAVGVSEKTIYLWTKQGDWARLRSASRIMPSMVVEHFYYQVQELNETIAAREFGKRYPTPQEAETIRKLCITIERMKKKSTQGESMELLQNFMEWLLPQDLKLTQTFTGLADRFLKTKAINGFHPYDVEYEEPTLFKPHKHEPLPPEEGSEPPQDIPHNPNQLSLFPDEDVVTNCSKAAEDTKAPSLFFSTAEALAEEVGKVDPALQRETEGSPLAPENSPLGEGTGECPLAPDNAQQEQTTDEKEITGTPSSLPSRDEQEITRNNSNNSYDAPTATPTEIPSPEQEITPQEEIGNSNNISSPSERSGEVAPKKKKPKPETITKYLGRRGEIDWSKNILPPGAQMFTVGDAIYYVIKKE